ncbi:MAG: DUF4202 domain-containing protein [Balneolaceae bacterium]
MSRNQRFQIALEMIDSANSNDPNRVIVDDQSCPSGLIYGQRMSETLEKFEPNASEALRLAARAQHIERWSIPREEYPMNRRGYLRWRNELKKFHASRADEILGEAGYKRETIDRVKSLLMKRDLKSDPESQTLEDVVCLVFMEHYFEDFSCEHSDDKIVSILKKTWRKMSKKGQNAALDLNLSDRSVILIKQALE